MGYQEELQRLVEAKASMRQSIIAKGVEVPEDAKIEDYPTYIAQINTGPSWDTENPTLEGLKAALDAGDYEAFKPNTLIPDKYGDTDINWVVGHYGTAIMSDGTTKEGVYLFKEKSLDTAMVFGSNVYYDQSSVNAYLNDTYFPGCSESLKNLVGEISVPVYTNRIVNAKLWLMSIGEVLGEEPTVNNGGGVAWDAWKIRTGLSTPSIGANNGRIMQNESGSIDHWWTRSRQSTSGLWYIYTNGQAYYSGSPSSRSSVVPAFFIAKGGN